MRTQTTQQQWKKSEMLLSTILVISTGVAISSASSSQENDIIDSLAQSLQQIVDAYNITDVISDQQSCSCQPKPLHIKSCIVGYQFKETDADYPGDYTNEPYGTVIDTNHNDINSYYVDGVSITRGSPRQHV